MTWHNLRFAYIGIENFEKADYCKEEARRLKHLNTQMGKNIDMKQEKEVWYYT